MDVRKKRVQHELMLQHSIVDFLRYKKIFAWITYQPLIKPGQFKMYHWSSAGIADILGFSKNRFFAIEVKWGKYRKPTEIQDAFLEEVRKNGHIAFVAWSLEDVEKGLDL